MGGGGDLRVGLEERGEKADLKATGERAVDGAIGGEGDEGLRPPLWRRKGKAKGRLGFWDRRYC